MSHCAAVEVSELWYELQSGELVEGTIFIWVRNIDAGSFSHILSVLCPVEFYRSGIEISHMADEHVLVSELHHVSGVDHRTGRRVCTETETQLIYQSYISS